MPVRVIIAEASYFMREMLCCLVESDPDIEVVATAGDPLSTRRLVQQLNPDVLVLDVMLIDTQRGDIPFPPDAASGVPVILLSPVTQRCMAISVRGLELGAFDVAPKIASSARDMAALRDTLIHQIHAAVRTPAATLPAPSPVPSSGHARGRRKAIAMAASAGGVEALSFLLQSLPEDVPPLLITQDLPAPFLPALAARLNARSPLTVRPAQPGETLQPGHAYLAHHHHLGVMRAGDALLLTTPPLPPVNGRCPSADVMFRSVAEELGEHSLGLMLTGRGSDGAEGLLALRSAGAATLTQAPESCRAPEAPALARRRGASEREVPLAELPAAILELC
jgi:two-component system chemotaxis response regulator CheB